MYRFFAGLAALSALASASSAKTESKTEIAGVFLELFETSDFEPCNSDERWWLYADGSISESFRKRIEALRAEHEAQSGKPLGAASPAYYLVASGDVSEQGEYGHMGAYDRQFHVTGFSVFRLATREERLSCVTSGMFPAE